MRANPHLLTGANKLWVRFFLLAVYATMYVRDHVRPEFHKALDIDPTEYDFDRLPHHLGNLAPGASRSMLDTDNPKFRAGLERVRILAGKIAEASEQGGFAAGLRKRAYQAQVGAVLLRLYTAADHQERRSRRPAGSSRPIEGDEPVATYGVPILATLIAWWFSTGAILYLDGLPRADLQMELRGRHAARARVALGGWWRHPV